MSTQLTLPVASKEQVKRSWAFAVDTSANKRRRQAIRDLNRCVITAVSREAKAFGVKAGMAAAEARLVMPELKVFVCNWKSTSTHPNSRLNRRPKSQELGWKGL